MSCLDLLQVLHVHVRQQLGRNSHFASPGSQIRDPKAPYSGKREEQSVLQGLLEVHLFGSIFWLLLGRKLCVELGRLDGDPMNRALLAGAGSAG